MTIVNPLLICCSHAGKGGGWKGEKGYMEKQTKKRKEKKIAGKKKRKKENSLFITGLEM
jgi:hypothetical protein